MRQIFLPDSLEALWNCLDSHPQARVYAGGTDLLVEVYKGTTYPEELICLERIEELKGVVECGVHIRIGACTTHTELLEAELLRRRLPILQKAVKQLGSPPIRNMGTIGGNICTASPAGDTLPPLYALNAEVELRSKRRVRRIELRKFIPGPGMTRLEPQEILTAVWVKKPTEYNVHHFEKVGLRSALACSITSLAALLRVATDGTVEKVAFAWGSVGPTIVGCREAEEAVIGRTLTPARLREAAALVQKVVIPISDVRAGAEYRRVLAGNLLLRLTEKVDSQVAGLRANEGG
ncbi:MAG: xanthine dehydrogenase family protein subunit M [Acidobacteriota bacterium]